MNTLVPTVRRLNPPVLTDEGFLTRPATYEFFSQRQYGQSLRHHAGGLFRKMVRAPAFTDSTIHFNVVCDICELHVKEPCTIGKQSQAHSYVYGVFSIEAATIIEYAAPFTEQRLNEGSAMLDSFNLLLKHLRGIEDAK